MNRSSHLLTAPASALSTLSGILSVVLALAAKTGEVELGAAAGGAISYRLLVTAGIPAATVGGRAYVLGGYDGTHTLADVLVSRGERVAAAVVAKSSQATSAAARAVVTAGSPVAASTRWS